MNRSWVIYLYRNKLFIPTTVKVRGGPVIDARPVRVFEFGKIDDQNTLYAFFREILKDRLILADEENCQDLLVKVHEDANARSYKQFINAGHQWSVREQEGKFQMSKYKSDKDGVMEIDKEYSSQFPVFADSTQLAEALTEELLKYKV